MRCIDIQNAKKNDRHERYVCIDIHEVEQLDEWAASVCPDFNQPYLGEIMRGRDGNGMAPKSFYLGRLKSMKSVTDRLAKGWKAGADKAIKLASDVAGNVAQPVDIRRRPSWGDRGDEYSRERLLDGHFDSPWRSSSRRLAIANPIINIVCGWGGNAGRSHDELFWSGATALALCTVLENAGYQTTLTAVAASRYGQDDYGPRPHRHTVICRLKGAGEYMRPDALASVVCSPAVFRTFVFSTMASTSQRTSDTLGNMISVDRAIPHAVSAGALEAPQVVLPDCFYDGAAEAGVKSALRDLADANLAALPEGVTW